MLPPASGGPAQTATRTWPGELLRLGLLTGFACWLAHPFLTARLIGGGDAWWYANMLRDFLTQVRGGIFPVWTGQTEFAFNGAVYPLRAAPFYQHLAGLLDLLTGRRLDTFALQNATVFVSLLGGVHVAYFALCRLAPARRNLAAVLSALYVACPGVLGLITSQDLYSSCLATPFLPLVTCGLALSLREDGACHAEASCEGGPVAPTCLDGVARRPKLETSEAGLVSPRLETSEGGWKAQRMMVVGLALTWYAHAPLAAWLTLISVGVQAVRLVLHGFSRQVCKEVAGGALLFAGLVAGVFASVATLRGGDSAGIIPYAIERVRIVAALREAFPHSLLPVRMPATSLGDLQLGYALWAVLGAGCAASLTPGRRRLLPLTAAAVVLVVLLLPIPSVTPWLWNSVPESLARLTYYWPMHRLYPVLAALALPLGILAFTPRPAEASRENESPSLSLSPSTFTRAAGAPPSLPPSLSLTTFTRAVGAPLSLGMMAVLWSGWEAGKLVATAQVRTATWQETALKERPENAPLMNHAYGLSLALPSYFSNGVMDPWFELRVLGGTGRRVIMQDNASFVLRPNPPPWCDFTAKRDVNPGIWNLSPELVLQPGRRHLLEFDFGGQRYAGTLQIEGPHFFRQYLLPASGQALAFGAKGFSAHWLPLWTTTDRPETIRLRFIPDASITTNRPPVFARYRWHTVDPQALPLRIAALSPLHLTVALEKPGLLETFRMQFPGYRAQVDGKDSAVERSPNGLVAVALPAGTHTVGIDYRPPAWLQLALAVSAATWLGLLVLIFYAWGSALRRQGAH